MTIGEDRNKNWFKNWQLCGVWKLPFCDHRAIKLTQNWLYFTNPCINFHVQSLVNTTPRYLNFSTCCSVLSFICRIHRLGFLERRSTSVFLLLIFIPAWSHAAENRSSACWRPCSEGASSTKSYAKSKRLILQLRTMTRLWPSNQFM